MKKDIKTFVIVAGGDFDFKKVSEALYKLEDFLKKDYRVIRCDTTQNMLVYILEK